MKSLFPTIAACLACLAGWASAAAQAQETLTLENGRLGLSVDRKTGSLVAVHNKLTGETYQVRGDEFDVEAVEFRAGLADAKLETLQREAEAVKARYQSGAVVIEVIYTLRGDSHFAEKKLTLISSRNYGLKKLVLSRPTFAADGLSIVSYRYPKYHRNPGEEASCTFFGRTGKGGFFTGVEMPFDASSASGQQLTLSYAPSLKVAAGDKLDCEPVYFGVYQRRPADDQPPAHPPIRGANWHPQGPAMKAPPVASEVLPLPSESDAMVAMTSAILGPPRFGLNVAACGWHSEMSWRPYTEQTVADDMKSLDLLASCGIDGITDSHPWGGEIAKMNALRANDRYDPGPLVRKFLEHARQTGAGVAMWSSMTRTSGSAIPFLDPQNPGQHFRSDKPEWRLDAGAGPPKNAPDWRKKTEASDPSYLKAGGNCLANRPFFDWWARINLEALATGYYKSWCMDQDFFGGTAMPWTVVPVDCQSALHDHLPGDSNYGCQRALARMVALVRQRNPQMFIGLMRPNMDLGVWSLRNADACFTLIESGTKDNLTGGDQIRRYSRVRVHEDFFPHYLDWPFFFPNRFNAADKPSTWSSDHIDYIMLSALSSAINHLLLIPTKTGIPNADKAELRKWLDWGRRNIAYLKVRKDLPDWPAPSKVDGSAHIVGDRGIVFLFNPNKQALEGQFALSEESIGMKGGGTYSVTQEYPQSGRTVKAAFGETVRWEVPAQTAAILRVQKPE
jgi:hypothetical protein